MEDDINTSILAAPTPGTAKAISDSTHIAFVVVAVCCASVAIVINVMSPLNM